MRGSLPPPKKSWLRRKKRSRWAYVQCGEKCIVKEDAGNHRAPKRILPRFFFSVVLNHNSQCAKALNLNAVSVAPLLRPCTGHAAASLRARLAAWAAAVLGADSCACAKQRQPVRAPVGTTPPLRVYVRWRATASGLEARLYKKKRNAFTRNLCVIIWHKFPVIVRILHAASHCLKCFAEAANLWRTVIFKSQAA